MSRIGRGRAPGERSPARMAVITAALPLALLAAVIVQVTVVNRLPLPGGDQPDLVLLLVTAVAVRAAPPAGALTGFAGGLALDVAPPQTHYAGEYALVFCLAGYAAARAGAVARDGFGDRSAVTSLVIMAAAAAAGEAGKAALGLLLSDPHVTGPAIRRVLPGSVLCDLLLGPVLYWLVAVVAGRRSAEPARGPRYATAGRLASVFRLASAGAAPGLRLAGSGPTHQGPSWARRQPKLRLADARSRPLGGTHRSSAGPFARPPLAGGRATKLHFSSRARSGLGPRSGLGRSRSLAVGAVARYASSSRPTRSPSRGWLRRDRAALAAPVRRRMPSRGWLGSSRARLGSSRGRLGSSRGGLGSSRARLGPSRRPLARPRAYPRGVSGVSPRRGRHPWRRRGDRGYPPSGGAAAYVSRPYPTRRRSYRRRLLAIVGVRR